MTPYGGVSSFMRRRYLRDRACRGIIFCRRHCRRHCRQLTPLASPLSLKVRKQQRGKSVARNNGDSVRSSKERGVDVDVVCIR